MKRLQGFFRRLTGGRRTRRPAVEAKVAAELAIIAERHRAA
jgi:hypothetical protein